MILCNKTRNICNVIYELSSQYQDYNYVPLYHSVAHNFAHSRTRTSSCAHTNPSFLNDPIPTATYCR